MCCKPGAKFFCTNWTPMTITSILTYLGLVWSVSHKTFIPQHLFHNRCINQRQRVERCLFLLILVTAIGGRPKPDNAASIFVVLQKKIFSKHSQFMKWWRDCEEMPKHFLECWFLISLDKTHQRTVNKKLLNTEISLTSLSSSLCYWWWSRTCTYWSPRFNNHAVFGVRQQGRNDVCSWRCTHICHCWSFWGCPVNPIKKIMLNKIIHLVILTIDAGCNCFLSTRTHKPETNICNI